MRQRRKGRIRCSIYGSSRKITARVRPSACGIAAKLIAEGKAYHCFCSSEQLEADRQKALAAGLPPEYPGTCRAVTDAAARERIANGERAVVRFRVPDDRSVAFTDLVRGTVTFHTSVIGDPVLLRSDGHPAYNFAVVIDDASMEVTHVVRGEDHISNTPRQILIYEALGFTPPAFAHLALVGVRGGSVDEPVAGRDGGLDGSAGLGRRALEDAEAERGKLDAVVQRDRRNTCGHLLPI